MSCVSVQAVSAAGLAWESRAPLDSAGSERAAGIALLSTSRGAFLPACVPWAGNPCAGSPQHLLGKAGFNTFFKLTLSYRNEWSTRVSPGLGLPGLFLPVVLAGSQGPGGSELLQSCPGSPCHPPGTGAVPASLGACVTDRALGQWPQTASGPAQHSGLPSNGSKAQ